MKDNCCAYVSVDEFLGERNDNSQTAKRIRGPIFQFLLKFSAALVLVITAGALMAQVGTGSITGTVTDSTGAVVVGASVTVTNAQTGSAIHLVSNAQGRYVAPELNVGVYNLEAQTKGFKAQKNVGIEVPVGRQMVVDFSLVVGQQSETITVQGGASQVETTTSEVSAQIGQTQMRELPLNGRDYQQLLLLAPGVQAVTPLESSTQEGRAQSFSVAGSRPTGQEILLDGAHIQTYQDRGAGNPMMGTSLGVDAIAEFQVLTNTYSARFGGSGSVINQTTRSGANQLHGSAFDFFRNSVLDAKNYFDPSSKSIPGFRRNQFGGTLGGPIKKDKFFFFVNYEGLRQLLGETRQVIVPDAQARLGIIDGVDYNPLNPAIAAALALWPALSSDAVSKGGGIADDVRALGQTGNEDYINTRWDYALGPSDNFFARYVYDNGNLTEPFAESSQFSGPLGLYPETGKDRNQYVTFGETHIMGAALVNDARFSFVRTALAAHTDTSYSALDFFPGENRQNGHLSIGSLSQLGPDGVTPLYQIQNTFSWGDDVVWTRGKHTLSFGAEVQRQETNLWDNPLTAGAWGFNSLTTFLQDDPASFVGAVSNEANSKRGYRETHLYPYFQDDWRVLPTLTLNLGLRYDFISNPTEQNDLMCAYEDPSSPTETDCTVVPNVFASNPTLKSLDPRVGLAWDPFKNHKTSIRAGVGLFHDPTTVHDYHASYSFAKPFVAAVQPCDVPGLPACVYPTPFAGVTIPIVAIAQAIAYHTGTTPFVMQYNLGVQREIAPNTVLNVLYIGSHGYNLLVNKDLNPPIPNIVNGVETFTKTGITPGQEAIGESTLRANNNLGSIAEAKPEATSWYNGLEIYATRNAGKSLVFQAGYTYSRCEDNSSMSVGGEASNSALTQYDPFNLMRDKGLCSFDSRQAFIGNAVYSFPFNSNVLVKGWQYSIIANVHSGNPFTVFDGFDRADLTNSNGIGGNERPDQVSGRSNNPKVGKATEWYDPTAFSLQAPGTLGDLGRDTLIAPGFQDFDMALAKETKITERLGAQFRFEVFNILNHPELGLPDQTLYTGPTATPGGVLCANSINCVGVGVPNPDAGIIHTTVSSSRQLQFSLKLTF